MNLAEFYDTNKIPAEDRIPHAKDILFIVPDRKLDISPACARLHLSKYEVAVTWSKPNVNMRDEIQAFDPSFILQIGTSPFPEYPTLSENESGDATLREQAHLATQDKLVNLHHHDEFSIKDGLGTIESLCKLLNAQRRSFACVTNHGSIGGWIKQYSKCKAANIKPIFGMEAYFSNYRGDDPEIKKQHRSANHITLIAKTKEGFDNLIRIHNDAQLNGFYYSPRANREAFTRWGKGIIALSGCAQGEIASALAADKEDVAEEAARFLMGAFEAFYIELPMIEYEPQLELNRRLIRFAQKMNLPMVMTLDSHYLEPEHADTHDVLVAIRYHKTVAELKATKDTFVRNLYYRDIHQLYDLFYHGFTLESGVKCRPFCDDVFTDAVFEKAYENTRLIAISVEDIKLDSKIKLPKLAGDGIQTLLDKTRAGFKARYLHRMPNVQEYADRIKRELAVINKLGWTDYFLIVDRIIGDAKEKFGAWAVDYGRGSAGGSLVSYCLGITDVDPIRYGLLFERFIDESRTSSPPDIDVDFDPRIRDWVKEHIVEIFGKEHVCSIGSYQTYKTKAVILDVTRVLGYDVHEAMNVTRDMDSLKALEDDDGEDMKMDQVPLDKLGEHYPELQTYLDRFPNVKFHAEILRNQVKNMSTHAGGVIISDIDITDHIPLLYDKADGENRIIISAWAEAGSNQELSAVGIVKFDLLGISNLSIVADCIEMIETTQGIKLKRSDIPIDDNDAIALESKRDYTGIFMFDSPLVKPIMKSMEISTLLDIATVTSVIRPGTRDLGLDQVYVKRWNGEQYETPAILKPILDKTLGIMVFQEQAMQIVQVLGGLTPVESYKFLKAIAKKIKAQTTAFKEKFLKGAQVHIDKGEITKPEVEEMWTMLETFCEYAFNLAHAISYGALTTAQLWLKHHYPTEYIATLLKHTKLGKEKHNEDVFVKYINYARRRGISVQVPNINLSKKDFVVSFGAIRFPIGHVKNVGSAADVIVANQPYKSVADFVDKMQKAGASRGVNKRVVDSLIQAGAFDCFGTRNEVNNEYYQTRGEKPQLPASEQWWIDQEIEMIGLCLSRPPLFADYEMPIKESKSKLIGDIELFPSSNVFGKIMDCEDRMSKKGNPMLLVTISDGMDTMKFFVFASARQHFMETMKQGMIGIFPLKAFEDGGKSRFLDDKQQIQVLKEVT
jgi:DNA polymerase-3 subunit alpha